MHCFLCFPNETNIFEALFVFQMCLCLMSIYAQRPGASLGCHFSGAMHLKKFFLRLHLLIYYGRGGGWEGTGRDSPASAL